MEEYISVLKHTRLFNGVGEDEIAAMADCMQFREQKFKKDEYVFRSGEYTRSIALLVRGELLIQKDDYWGNRSIVDRVSVGETFGEAYAMQDSEAILNDVVATQDSTVLMFQVEKLLKVCTNSCKFHNIVIQNLMQIVSAKNRMLTQKIDYMSKRSTREKLIAYLSAQSKRSGSPVFDIEFNRQQLADFLSVDRSAMSNELCKMRDEGMLTFDRNHFELIG